MTTTRRALLALVAFLALVVGCAVPPDAEPAPVAPTTHAATTAPPSAASTATPTSHLVGTLNPAVRQATIRTTICVAGWTRTVRPPVSYTNRLKRAALPVTARLADYEEDHLMPLALGGSPRDPANLKPVPIRLARAHDAWEDRLHDRVCAVPPTLTLRAAQLQMSRIKAGLR